MSFWSSVGNFFKKVAGVAISAFQAAGGNGLTDQIVALALVFVKEAATKFSDNAEKREWAVQQLIQRHVPESLARLGVELAYQQLKKEIGKIPTPPPVPVDTTGIIWGS